MPVRSEEAIMVPEFTHAVGGAAGVHALNRAAETGTLGLLGPGMARGGVVGQKVHDVVVNKVGALLERSVDDYVGAQTGGFASNGNWGPVNMSGFAANTAAAKAYIEQHFSGVSSIGGLYGGSVAGSDHPYGKALDVMIANYASREGIAAGTRIADWFRTNVNAFGSKYVIWRDQIDNLRGAGWQPYSHPGGNNDTLAHRDHVHLSFLTGSGEFTGQPVSARGDDNPAKGGWLERIIGKIKAGGATGSDPGGAGVERWRPMAMQALTAVGQYLGRPLTGFVDNMMLQIRTESSGDPNAQNNTDINAQRGTPSMGLLQTILPTFINSLRGTPFADLIPRGPKDPWANMIASILYGNSRYGSLDRAYRGVAYAKGGIVPDFGGGVDSVRGWLTPGEGVFTKPQTDAILTHARALEDGYAGRAPSIQVGDIHMASADPAAVLDEIMWRAKVGV
jgi:hypothetical protein